MGVSGLRYAMKSRIRQYSERSLYAATLLGFCGAASLARAQCSDASLSHIGITPLPERSFTAYKGYPGGLYPNYANNRPPAHFAAGMAIATNQIQPVGPNGSPTNNGAIVLLSIGMSNTTME